MTTEKACWLLKWLMRAFGVITLMAVVGVLMPHSWMNAVHQSMGMGDLPDLPIMGYLTRSASALYMYLGALFLFLSRDVVRNLPTIRFCATMGLIFGLFMLGLDLAVGMPLRWTVSEGPVVCAYCLTGLWLVGRIRRGDVGKN